MDSQALVSTLHLVTTLGMFGVILVVQIVHYPLMAKVGRAGYPDYAKSHTDRMGVVVGPLMVPEMGTALWLALLPPEPELRGIAWLGLGMLAGIWAVTVAFSVPAHARLLRGWDDDAHRRLVSTNWIRTVLWTARVPIALALSGVI